jgi:protein TonB
MDVSEGSIYLNVEIMIALILIITAVAGVSLYDFYLTRSWQQVTSEIRNDVVFEHRNRDYGAFVIRRDYNRDLLFILGGVLCSVGVLYAGYAGFKKDPESELLRKPVMQEFSTIIEFAPKEKQVVQVEKQAKQASTPKTEVLTEPQVVDKPVITEPVKPQDVLTNLQVSSNGGGTGGDPFSGGTGNGNGTGGGSNPDDKPLEPERFPEVEAEYPGGYPEMIKFIQRNLVYPQTGIEMGAEGKCYLRFVVDENGDIRSVNVIRGVLLCKDCDKEAIRVLNSMPKWKPGRSKGNAIATYFDLPINFELE